MKGNNDATDPGQDQAPAAPHNSGRSAHHQPQNSADMVSRITAADDTQVAWLRREGLLDELDSHVSAFPGPSQGSRFRAGGRRRPELDDLHAATRAGSAIVGRSDSAGRMTHRLHVTFCDNPAPPGHARAEREPCCCRPDRQEPSRAYGFRCRCLENGDHAVVAGQCPARGRRSWMKTMVTG